MAVNCQVTSLGPAPRTVALPVSLMAKRRSSVPLAALLGGADFASPGAAVFGSARPPVTTTSRWTSPVARMTNVLPAGTDKGGADGLEAIGAGSPPPTAGRNG